MDIYEARRIALAEVIRVKFGGSQVDFAKAAGISASYVSRMLKADGEAARKRIGEDMARKLEDRLGLSADFLVSPIFDSGGLEEFPVAHLASLRKDTIPLLTWRELMTFAGEEGGRKELPQCFWLTLADDAMAPKAPSGTDVLIDCTLTASVGDAVLLIGPDGKPHMRLFGQSMAYGFQAVPTNPLFETFHGQMPGVRVMGVMTGIKTGWSKL